jgi:PEP-CTERM motif
MDLEAEFAPNSSVAGSRVPILSGKVLTVNIVGQFPDSNCSSYHSHCQLGGALAKSLVRVQLLMLKLSQFCELLHTSEVPRSKNGNPARKERATEMNKRFYAAVAVTALMITGAAESAKADLVYDLTVDHCTGGCNPGSPGTSMGTVDLKQNGTGDVLVTVDLVSPLEFVNTGLQNTIDFNLGSIVSGVTAANFSNGNFSLTSGNAGSLHFDGFGDFQYSIQLNEAQGAGGAQASPLSFDILATGLTESSFTTNAGGWFFGVDVYNTANGNTGPTGTGGASPVPEPGTIGLLGAALVGIGFCRKKGQQRA